jgi:predicted SnoaL-like aldol condensation-catalyzing enzyme
MIDGPTEINDLEKTESNREIVRAFVETILVNRETGRLDDYIDDKHFVEHNPGLGDGLSSLRSMFSGASVDGAAVRYDKAHRFLAEGNFVLSVSEGSLKGVHSSFYDLFRLTGDRIVEHWDTTEAIPPRSEWKNDNGKGGLIQVGPTQPSDNEERYAVLCREVGMVTDLRDP